MCYIFKAKSIEYLEISYNKQLNDDTSKFYEHE